jgi:hypothetical protein
LLTQGDHGILLRVHVQASNGVDETSKQATIEKAVAISRMVNQMTTEQYQQSSYSHDEKARLYCCHKST